MMSTVDNLYTSVAALKEAYTHVERTDQHVNRARHVQNTIAIIGLACIGLLAISFVCAKALSFNAFTVQVIETAILGSVVSLVIGFAIIKLVSQNLKQHKASLLAKMDGQMLLYQWEINRLKN